LDGKLPEKHIALTLDDGPQLPHAWIVLHMLKRCGIKVHFFIVGRQATRKVHKAVIAQMSKDGHQIGSHTQTHKYKLSRETIEIAEKEITKGHRSVERALGYKTPFFRFPFGSIGPRPEVYRLLRRWSIVHMLWNIHSKDTAHTNVDKLMKITLSGVEKHNSGIWVAHDRKKQTVYLLSRLLPNLIDQGYTFATFVPDKNVRGQKWVKRVKKSRKKKK